MKSAASILEALGAVQNKNDYQAVTLGQLIETLAAADPELIVADGFTTPDSWRGVYAFLAFSPEYGMKVADMLEYAKNAVGRTFTGYKGGEFTMTRETPCFIAAYGQCSDEDAITVDRLKKMLGLEAIAEKRPSNLPERPALTAAYRGDDAIVSAKQLDAFNAYVNKLQEIAARADACSDRERGPAFGDAFAGGEASLRTAEYILGLR